MMPGFGREQLAGAFRGDQKLGRRQIDDAAEAADIVGAFDLEPPEGEIGEVGIERGLWMPREEPPPRPPPRRSSRPCRTASPARLAADRRRRPCRRTESRRGGLGRGSWCAGRGRNEKDRSAGRVGRHGDQRGIRIAAACGDRGERGLQRAPHQSPRIGGQFGLGRHLASVSYLLAPSRIIAALQY